MIKGAKKRYISGLVRQNQSGSGMSHLHNRL